MLLLQLLQYVKVGGSCIGGAKAVAAEAACAHLTHPSSFSHRNFETSNRAHSTAHPQPAHTMIGVDSASSPPTTNSRRPTPGVRSCLDGGDCRLLRRVVCHWQIWPSLEPVLPWRPIP